MPKKHEISPEEALDFLESIRGLSADVDEETKMISIRVPQNLLRALKLKAKFEKRKYQSMIVESIRESLKP